MPIRRKLFLNQYMFDYRVKNYRNLGDNLAIIKRFLKVKL